MEATEDEMTGQHQKLNEHEFEQTLGDSEGQGNLVCCSPQGRKESIFNPAEGLSKSLWGQVEWPTGRPDLPGEA